MLPNDIHMLVSMINMKLRDDDMSLSHILDIHDMNEEDFLKRLEDMIIIMMKQIVKLRQNKSFILKIIRVYYYYI